MNARCTFVTGLVVALICASSESTAEEHGPRRFPEELIPVRSPETLDTLKQALAGDGWREVCPLDEFRDAKIAAIVRDGKSDQSYNTAVLRHVWLVQLGPVDIPVGRAKEIYLGVIPPAREYDQSFRRPNGSTFTRRVADEPSIFTTDPKTKVAAKYTHGFLPDDSIDRKLYFLQGALELVEAGKVVRRWYVDNGTNEHMVFKKPLAPNR